MEETHGFFDGRVRRAVTQKGPWLAAPLLPAVWDLLPLQDCTVMVEKVLSRGGRRLSLGLHCVPQNLYVEVLAPKTSEYNYIWRQVFKEVIKEKTRLFVG